MRAKLFTTAITAGALFATGALAQDTRDRQDRVDRTQMQQQDRQNQRSEQMQRTRQQAQQISADDLSSGQIMRIQRALGRAGFSVGPIDGNWGSSTQDALENFQEY